MLECPHGCMHDQFCVKFPNHHCCMCVMEIMWDIPFIPEPLVKPNPDICHVQPFYRPWAEIPTFQSLPSEENKERKFPIKRGGESKKGKKIPDQTSGEKEMCRKAFGPDNIWTIQNCHQVKQKERKTRPKVVLSLWLPTQNPVRRWLVRLTLNKNKKGNGQKHSKPNFPPKNQFPRRSPIDPWSRM